MKAMAHIWATVSISGRSTGHGSYIRGFQALEYLWYTARAAVSTNILPMFLIELWKHTSNMPHGDIVS